MRDGRGCAWMGVTLSHLLSITITIENGMHSLQCKQLCARISGKELEKS